MHEAMTDMNFVSFSIDVDEYCSFAECSERMAFGRFCGFQKFHLHVRPAFEIGTGFVAMVNR